MTGAACPQEARDKWGKCLAEWLPSFLAEHPVLGGFRESASVVLHGSLTLGFDDPFSDIDLWCLLPDAQVEALAGISETLFFAFQLGGKEGHINVESVSEFERRIRRCHMDTIFQFRHGVTLLDPSGVAERCRSLASAPMPDRVRRIFFRHHYIEMRGEHRACDNPMERHDPVALLLSLPKALAHAMQAAIVLDGQPYPYDKWLFHVAKESPTGARLAPSIERILALLGAGHLRYVGGERTHPISLELRVIRGLLIEAAKAAGLDEPWLIAWWLHMDADRAAIRDATWEA